MIFNMSDLSRQEQNRPGMVAGTIQGETDKFQAYLPWRMMSFLYWDNDTRQGRVWGKALGFLFKHMVLVVCLKYPRGEYEEDLDTWIWNSEKRSEDVNM